MKWIINEKEERNSKSARQRTNEEEEGERVVIKRID
jgi:hypothetical protein